MTRFVVVLCFLMTKVKIYTTKHELDEVTLQQGDVTNLGLKVLRNDNLTNYVKVL